MVGRSFINPRHQDGHNNGCSNRWTNIGVMFEKEQMVSVVLWRLDRLFVKMENYQ